MYGKCICNSLADWIHNILKPPYKYEPIPKQIKEEEIEEEEREEEIEEEEREEERDQEEREETNEKETNEKETNEKETKEDYYTDLSISWQCKQCDAFNHKDIAVCRDCNIHTEVQQVLEEIILRVYEKNIGLYETNNNLSNSPNTTTINRMAVGYKTETNI